MTTLQTDRLLLRPWRDEDLPAFAALNGDAEVMAFMPKRLSRGESDAFADRIRRRIDTEGWGLWALEVPGVAPFAGYVGLSVPSFVAPFTPCVEIGWRLSRACWGRGYATEAARLVVDHGFRALGLAEIVSFTYQGNARSRAVMQRLGMRRDTADDFDHPALPGHWLQRHVLYRVSRA
jgi:RimJ/RimL family protein N-acetyltransferase